jgi:hypothetical protein
MKERQESPGRGEGEALLPLPIRHAHGGILPGSGSGVKVNRQALKFSPRAKGTRL